MHVERRTTSLAFLGWVDRLWLGRRKAAHRLALRRLAARRQAQSGSVSAIICRVFGPYCSEALAVARCESGFSIHAVNGQYLGLFQMGSSERATYATIGYSTAYEQTVAAHNYFAVAGWGPWSCRP